MPLRIGSENVGKVLVLGDSGSVSKSTPNLTGSKWKLQNSSETSKYKIEFSAFQLIPIVQ